jgi:hypothetical protein
MHALWVTGVLAGKFGHNFLIAPTPIRAGASPEVHPGVGRKMFAG